MDHIVSLDLSRNYSFFTVPAMLLSALVPHLYAIVTAGKDFDRRRPRTLTDKVAATTTIDQKKKQTIIRAQAASDNGFETLGFYSAAVVAANQAGVDPRTLNLLTGGYVLSRLVFNAVYIGTDSNGMSAVRSLLWQSGVILTSTLWVKAGLKMMKTYVF